ncbi:MAG: hypothetical protein F6K42_20110 [Leptolyngbya sp. SIO1D8]|nr:hypothetical protein [Leptolyngbya sp. SIO1D8]
MLPIVIPEELVSLFKYWREGIQVGMAYRNELYAQLRIYDSDKRLVAYEDGYRLSETGSQVCITVNESGYTLWQSLRSAPLSNAEPAPSRKTLSFQDQLGNKAITHHSKTLLKSSS